jgi:hypothetical protein
VTRPRLAAFAATLAACIVAAPGVSRSAPAAPHGTVGNGQATFAFTNPTGNKLAFAGQVAFEQLDDQVRIDLTSLTITNAAAPSGHQLAPGGGFSVVLDRKEQRFVVWSDARRAFFVGTLPKPPSPFAPSTAASPKPSPSPQPSGSPRAADSPLSGLKNLKAFSFGVDMTGRGTTNGHPSTGFAYHLHSESNDGKVNDLTGTLQTADDLDGLPLVFTASVAAQSGFVGNLRVELLSIEKRDPSKRDFLVPAGFTAVENPLELVLPGTLTPAGR